MSAESTDMIIRVLGVSAYNSRRLAALKSETWVTKMIIPPWTSWSICKLSISSLFTIFSLQQSSSASIPPELHWLDPRLAPLHSKTRPAGRGPCEKLLALQVLQTFLSVYQSSVQSSILPRKTESCLVGSSSPKTLASERPVSNRSLELSHNRREFLRCLFLSKLEGKERSAVDELTSPCVFLVKRAMGETSREIMEVALSRAIFIQCWHKQCLNVFNPGSKFWSSARFIMFHDSPNEVK